ncbi:L,D-transpeptidase [Jiella sp. MQZ9-1]|uniref:L,D-transpeptidase n=1 Tax=Jiella flava TaxID=2816857 RepID=A0A939JSQ5_9HYPH|nr:L,D-transpeptidase [Jiella flava]MBO0661340.1 L,D-transpeptidase [Jiella flava]MCD2469985.1 L,D-transpeptidase [Jiella flava]
MTFKLSIAVGAAIATLMLAGCADNPQKESLNTGAAAPMAAAYASPETMPAAGDLDATWKADYAARDDDGFHLPAIPYQKVDPQFRRQEVSYPEGIGLEPGTVIVDTPDRFLYLIEPGGKAMRYGIGVGRSGFSWAGDAEVHDKQHWPKWFPPKEMIARKPELEPYADGMQPGLTNPLGARALYLWQNGKDTLFRLHGTPEWWTIGTAASSGCIRLMNQDIIDLFSRVPLNAKVIVKQGNEKLASR